MKKEELTKMMSACGNPIRISVLGMLVRAEPKGLVAGKIARKLKMSHTKLSFHLRILVDNGMVYSQRKGQTNIYRVYPLGIARMVRYLVGTAFSNEYAKVLRDPKRGQILISLAYSNEPLSLEARNFIEGMDISAL